MSETILRILSTLFITKFMLIKLPRSAIYTHRFSTCNNITDKYVALPVFVQPSSAAAVTVGA